MEFELGCFFKSGQELFQKGPRLNDRSALWRFSSPINNSPSKFEIGSSQIEVNTISTLFFFF